MAKKKNAPVLRAQGGGGQPETKTITKSYAVRDKWLDKAKDNLVEFKSVDGEISDLMVNGEPAGGGGDFSLVAVNVTNNSQTEVQIQAPILDADNNIIVPVRYSDAESDYDFQFMAPAQGYIDTVAQGIQLGSVTGTSGVTVTTVAPGVYQLNITGAGSIVIA